MASNEIRCTNTRCGWSEEPDPSEIPTQYCPRCGSGTTLQSDAGYIEEEDRDSYHKE